MSSYWIQRAERELIQREKDTAKQFKIIEKAYAEAIKDIKLEIEAFYGRYAEEGEISLAQAKERLNVKQLASFKQEQSSYRRALAMYKRLDDKATQKHYEQAIRDLKDASARAYVTKMDEIMSKIKHQIHMAAFKEDEVIYDALKQAYEDSYYGGLFDLYDNEGVAVTFTQPSDKQLDEAVRAKWQGENYSDRIWKNKDALIKNLETLVPQHFVMGGGAVGLSKKLSERMNVSLSNAKRLIRTEMNRLANEARLKSYQDAGIEQYEFVATLDSKTSEICQSLDGRIFDVKDRQSGVNAPAMHPYCRSTTIPHFEDDEIGEYTVERAARGDDGKTVMVEGRLNYGDWVEKYAPKQVVNRIKKTPLANDMPPVQIPLTLLGVHDKDYGMRVASSSDFAENFFMDPEKFKEYTKMEKDFRETMTKLFEENSLGMRIPNADILEQILDSHFKNQHEVGSSGGGYNPLFRQMTAQRLFDIPTEVIEKMKPVDFEKYGYLVPGDIKNSFATMKNVYQYGDVVVRFKDSVKNTATFSFGDSLDDGVGFVSLVNDPSLQSIGGNAKYYMAGRYKDNWVETMNEVLLDSSMSLDDRQAKLNIRYIEIQYHGRLGPEHIESVTVQENSLSPKLKKRLKEMGIEYHELSELY